MAIDAHAKARYVAFDLEIAREIPEDTDDWKALRPLGISCAATHKAVINLRHLDRGPEYEFNRVYHGKMQTDGRYASRMTSQECCTMARHLIAMHAFGFTLVTYNGLGFDLDVLAEECQNEAMARSLRSLALDHVDIAFAFFAEKGFMPSLAKACEGMGLEGKTEGMSGAKAPEMWATGDQEKVLEYVAQDARVTGQLYEAVLANRRLRWITRSGAARAWRPRAWGETPDGCRRIATVSEALKLPEPDNSWMDDPWQRAKFSAWLEG